MKKPTGKRYWLIVGFDGAKCIYTRRVEVGQFTDDQIKALLQALATKGGLTYDEVVGAYAKRRTNIANDLLHVHHDARYSTYMCGDNPHFAACVADSSDKIVKRPALT